MNETKKKRYSYIDEVLLEALAQVVNKGHLACVVLQQDKVLHSHPIPGCQGALHHCTHTVTAHRLTERNRETEKQMSTRLLKENIQYFASPLELRAAGKKPLNVKPIIEPYVHKLCV